MQALDKQTEALIKRIERAARVAKLQRLARKNAAGVITSLERQALMGVPFHQVVATSYNPELQTLLIYWSLGSILLTGPKAEAFFERFSENKGIRLANYTADRIAGVGWLLSVAPGRRGSVGRFGS